MSEQFDIDKYLGVSIGPETQSVTISRESYLHIKNTINTLHGAIKRILFLIDTNPKLAFHFTGTQALDCMLEVEAKRNGIEFEQCKAKFMKHLAVEPPPKGSDHYTDAYQQYSKLFHSELQEAKHRLHLERNAGDLAAVAKLEGLIEWLETTISNTSGE